MSPPLQPPSLAQLHFQFQRIAPVRADAVGWHEALIRWHLPDGTIRGPVDVLPYWLSPNHQSEFTRFTIERAAETLGVHPAARVSINLSPRQVTHPISVGTLEALRADVRGRLIIELTEQRMRDMSTLWSSVAALREKCELVVLDDVTRHDMTTRFRDDIPVDGIKLDRSVMVLLADPDERERTIRFIQRATERFAVVVAEGIEDVAVRGMLEDLGITHLQGFGISRPARQLVGIDGGIDERRGARRKPLHAVSVTRRST